MARKITVSALFAAFALFASAAIPVRWTVDTFRVKPLVYECYHGETLDIAAAMTAYGEPLDLHGKTARLYWQTNGMDDVWWTTNASVRVDGGFTNVLAATFSGAYDTGAPSVTGFVGVEGENYRAAFQLKYLASPGFSPSTISSPTRCIDWRTTRMVNIDAAPFATNEIVDQKVGTASNNVLVAANAYTDIAVQQAGGMTPEMTSNVAGRVVSNVVTKSFVEGLGVSGGNVLHCSGGTGGLATHFVEGTEKLIEYINAGKPIYCQYGGNIWAYLANITPAEIGASLTGYYISFICGNPSAYANGVATPLIITCILIPSSNYHEVHVATYRLLEDNLSSLTNSVNFKNAVNAVSVGGVSSVNGKTGAVTLNATDVGAIQTNKLNTGMTWKSGSSSWMNGTLAIGNTGTLQVNNTAKTWFINPANVKMGNGLTYAEADTMQTWIGKSVAIPFGRKVNSNYIGNRYEVTPTTYGIDANAFVGGKFFATSWSDYMIYQNDGGIISVWGLPWYLSNNYVPNTRKVNGHQLTGDITIETMDGTTVTNIVREANGGVWDSTLQVWWTPKMDGGKLTYQATTNVNIQAIN